MPARHPVIPSQLPLRLKHPVPSSIKHRAQTIRIRDRDRRVRETPISNLMRSCKLAIAVEAECACPAGLVKVVRQSWTDDCYAFACCGSLGERSGCWYGDLGDV